MATSEEFAKAQEQVKTLKTRPSNDALLELYAFYKQATEGDVAGKRPGMLDLKGRAKFDAWAGAKGTSREVAMDKYVAAVKKLLAAEGRQLS